MNASTKVRRGDNGTRGKVSLFDFKRATEANLPPLAAPTQLPASAELTALYRPGQDAAVSAIRERLAHRVPEAETAMFEVALDENAQPRLVLHELRDAAGNKMSCGDALNSDLATFTGDLSDRAYLDGGGQLIPDSDLSFLFHLSLAGPKPPGRAGFPAAERFHSNAAAQRAALAAV